MDTSCEKCEFAKRADDGKQIGCTFNRIDKYESQKVAIETINDSFLIKNRICNLCRATDNNDWGLNLSLQEKMDKAWKEIELRLCAIVVIDPKTTIDDIIKTAKSIEKQKIPIDTNFIITSNIPKSGDVIQALKKNFPGSSNLRWNVRLCYARDNGKPLDKYRASDTAIFELNQKDYLFYTMVDPGAIVPPDFSERLNKIVNEDLCQFIYLHQFVYSDEGKEYSIGPLVHLAAHRAVGGNAYAEHDVKTKTGEIKTIKCDSIHDKILFLAIDQNCQHLIKDLYEVCYQN